MYVHTPLCAFTFSAGYIHTFVRPSLTIFFTVLGATYLYKASAVPQQATREHGHSTHPWASAHHHQGSSGTIGARTRRTVNTSDPKQYLACHSFSSLEAGTNDQRTSPTRKRVQNTMYASELRQVIHTACDHCLRTLAAVAGGRP